MSCYAGGVFTYRPNFRSHFYIDRTHKKRRTQRRFLWVKLKLLPQLPQQGLRVRDFKLAAIFHIQLFHRAVLYQHRITL